MTIRILILIVSNCIGKTISFKCSLTYMIFCISKSILYSIYYSTIIG